jgi:hypothetical protein
MGKHPFDVIPEAAATRVSATEVAAHQAQGKILEELVRGILVAQGAAEVTSNRSPVALKELLAGRSRCVRPAAVRLGDHYPGGGNQAKVCLRRLRHARLATLPWANGIVRSWSRKSPRQDSLSHFPLAREEEAEVGFHLPS